MSLDPTNAAFSGSAWQQIANDPILGALFKSADARRSPLVPRIEASRRFRKWWLAIPIVIAGWIVWPYYAVYDLAVAVRDGDVSALENRVAWDSVRQGLRGDLNAMLLQKIRADTNTGTDSGAALGAGLAITLGPVIVDRMVDSFVTPQGIAAARRADKNADSSSDAQQDVHKTFDDTIRKAREFRWDQIKYAFFDGSPFSFRLEFLPDRDPPLMHPAELQFQWSGSWKLTRVMLPTDALDALSTAAKNQPAPISQSTSKPITNQSTSESTSPAPEATKEPPASKPQIETSWSIEESKSPIDDSPQVTGMLHADGSADSLSLTPPTMLGLRCDEKKTEAYLAKPFSFLGTNPMKVLVRINDGKPIETQRHPASNGQGVFAPAAVQFIRALPDNGKLFIRVTGFDGTTIDGAFTLGKVSEIRDKIAADCHWPGASTTAH